VLVRSNNHLPSGQLRFGQGPKPPLLYFTRLEAASHRFSPPGSCFRVTGCARTLPEEPVNPASSAAACAIGFRGTEPTSLAQPFPGRPGLSKRLLAQTFVPTNHLVLSMNCDQATRKRGAVNQIISTELFTTAGNAKCNSTNVHGVQMRDEKVVHRPNVSQISGGE